MTLRAVILGLLVSAFIAAVGYVNDSVLNLNYLVGNHFPTSVFGMLVIVLLGINPALGALKTSWRLRPPELAVVVALALVACSVPGSSTMRLYTPSLAMPVQFNRISPGWQKNDVLDQVPDAMLPGGGEHSQRLMDGYLRGLGEPDRPIGVERVPWDLWSGPNSVWPPILVLVGVAVICMSLIVHRQWSRHERLRYPIATFADSLLSGESSRGLADIFRSRTFWIGAAIVIFIRLVNGIQAWHPESIHIPLQFDFTPVRDKFPFLTRVWHGFVLLRPQYFPMVVGFAYFLASEVSFSLGISTLGIAVVGGVLWTAGVDLAENNVEGGVLLWQRFGSYLGLALILVYVGRRYYSRVLLRAVTFVRGRSAEGYAAWAMRGLIVSTAALVMMFMALGLNGLVAALTVGLILLLFLVMSRISAESGLIFIQPWWHPVAVLLGLFGASALGPSSVAVAGLIGVLTVYDPRECLMPFVVNGLRICDAQGVSVARVGRWAPIVFAGALAIAVPVVLWANYNWGAPDHDEFAVGSTPRVVFDGVDRITTRLRLDGQLAGSRDLSSAGTIARMDPDGRFLWSAGAGLAAVLILTALRLRLPWWPLHPIMLAVWGTWAMDIFSHSLLLGWAIKEIVSRLGGTPAYAKGKVFMIGVIAGDLLAGLGFMIYGAAYYAVTGLQPAEYWLLPS